MAEALDEERLLVTQRHPGQLLVGLFEQRRELCFGVRVVVAAQRGLQLPPEMRVAAQSPLPGLFLEETCQDPGWLYRSSLRWVVSGSRLSMLRVIAFQKGVE